MSESFCLQVTGEALYTDDVPLPQNALHAALVKSIRPHAKITSVNPSAALQVRHLFRPLQCAPSCSSAFMRLFLQQQMHDHRFAHTRWNCAELCLAGMAVGQSFN